jgi:hypothetical protein
MADRQATVVIADDLLWSLNGKFTMLGIYTGDISIPADPSGAPQLVFLFIFETDVSDPFQSVTLHLELPGRSPVLVPLPVPFPQVSQDPARTRWTVRWPCLVPNVVLHPGKITAKVIHERGELIAATPWVVLMPPSS